MTLRTGLLAICLLLGLSARAEVPEQPAEPTVTYTVQPGDKLIVLAKQILTHPNQWSEVAQFNQMAQPNRIKVGQQIRFPLRLVRWAAKAARLVSANGDVQLNGAPVAMGAAVAEGDRLRAGANSSAVIALEDGSRVQLMPMSIAELVKNREYGDKTDNESSHWFAGFLRLTQGAIEALASPGIQRASPLQVTTPTSIVGVRGTHFRVTFDSVTRSEVIEGLVVAENPAQGASADLSAGTGAVIRPEEKEIRVKPLLAAPDLSQAPTQVQTQDAWQWPQSTGAKAWRAQLAADEAFNQIVQEVKLDSPTWAMSGLPLGRWFARVRAIDNDGLEGFDAYRTLEIVATPVPDWTLKTSQLVYSNGVTQLRWTPVEPDAPAAGQWRAEILKDGSPVGAISVHSTAGSFAELATLDPGRYTVQIDGENAEGIPFQRKVFQLQIPKGWGTSSVDISNPLQLTE